jgi:WD40 repeat protein
LPDPFPETTRADLTRIEGGHVSYEDLEAWLVCRVMHKSCDVLELRASHDIERVAFSPDGDFLIAGGMGLLQDETLSLLRVSDGALLREWAHDGKLLEGELASTIIRVDYSPDGQLIASSGEHKKAIRLWRVSDGSLVSEISLDSHAQGLKFSPDGQTIAAGMADNTVRLWRVSDGSELSILKGHSNWVFSIAFSPNGKLLASGSRDGTIRLWQVSDGTELKILEIHADKVTTVAFSPDGHILASGSTDGTVRLWQIPDGKLDTTIELVPVRDDPLNPEQKKNPSVSSVAFSPDGQILAVGSYDAAVYLIQVSDSSQVQVLEDFSDMAYITTVVFSPNDRLLAIATQGTLQLRKIE